MTRSEIQAAAKEAEDRARALAAHYERRAAAPHATEVDAIIAETAAIYLRIGERKSKLVPVELAEALTAEINAVGEQQEAEIIAAARAEKARGGTEPHIYQAAQNRAEQAVAALEHHQEELLKRLAQHVLDAWVSCCAELMTLDQPLRTITSATTTKQ